MQPTAQAKPSGKYIFQQCSGVSFVLSQIIDVEIFHRISENLHHQSS